MVTRFAKMIPKNDIIMKHVPENVKISLNLFGTRIYKSIDFLRVYCYKHHELIFSTASLEISIKFFFVEFIFAKQLSLSSVYIQSASIYKPKSSQIEILFLLNVKSEIN